MSACLGCGSSTDAEGPAPTPDHCGDCPPWTCEQCGGLCSMTSPCVCWVSLEDMAMADIKALFASDGGNPLSLGAPVRPEAGA